MSDRDFLHLCPDCKQRPDGCFVSDVRGRGVCLTHGPYHVSNDRLDIQCRECAVMSGKCQFCGKKFAKTFLVLGMGDVRDNRA